MLVGLGHVDLVRRELERSLAFYAAVSGPLGLQEPVLFEGERGERIHYLRFPRQGSGSLGLRPALEEQDFELYAPGLHHLAFAVETRAELMLHTRLLFAPGRKCYMHRGCFRNIARTTTRRFFEIRTGFDWK